MGFSPVVPEWARGGGESQMLQAEVSSYMEEREGRDRVVESKEMTAREIILL